MGLATACSGSATVKDPGRSDGGHPEGGGQDSDGAAGTDVGTDAGGDVGTDGCSGAACGGCAGDTDCPSTGSACVVATCSTHVCATKKAALGTACTDNGGVVCDGIGSCTASHCSDGVKDADETATDCGGATCPKCAAGSTCAAPTDCTSGDCSGATCVTCGTSTSIDTCCPNGMGVILVDTKQMCAPEGAQWISCDGRFKLIMQTDGNLVLYMGARALWASNTVGCGGCVSMQGDGNLVVYDSGGQLPGHGCWASGTNGHTPATLALQNDGNLVLYSGPTAVWATNTAGH
jgi:hypothetical protein